MMSQSFDAGPLPIGHEKNRDPLRGRDAFCGPDFGCRKDQSLVIARVMSLPSAACWTLSSIVLGRVRGK